jgi:hypothetical protein
MEGVGEREGERERERERESERGGGITEHIRISPIRRKYLQKVTGVVLVIIKPRHVKFERHKTSLQGSSPTPLHYTQCRKA